MTNYENDIMNLLEGDTPKQKYGYLIAIIKMRETLQDARRQIQMMGERMPLHLMTASDSQMISIITHVLEETKIK